MMNPGDLVQNQREPQWAFLGSEPPASFPSLPERDPDWLKIKQDDLFLVLRMDPNENVKGIAKFNALVLHNTSQRICWLKCPTLGHEVISEAR